MAKRTETRDIYEKAYDHFNGFFGKYGEDKDLYALADEIDEFIRDNTHGDFFRSVMAVFSAIESIRGCVSKVEGHEQSIASEVSTAAYFAGRRDGLRSKHRS